MSNYNAFHDPESNPGFLRQLDERTQISGNYQYFGIFFVIGVLLTFISLFYIPAIPISPGRFSSLSVMGSLCMLFSLVFLKGFNSCVNGLMEGDRKLYTCVYCGSLVITFLASMVFRNYFISLLGAIVQVSV